MSLRSGLIGQMMVGKESTYGTRVTPTRGYEFAKEGFQYDIDRIEAFGIRAAGAGGASVQRTDRWVAGKKSVSGSISFDGKACGVGNKGFAMLFENATGADDTITTPGGGTISRDHTFALGDPFGKSLTIQVGTPDTSGTIRVREYEGCKITSFEFAQALDSWLAFDCELDGEEETTSQTLGTFSFPASQELYHWGQAVYQIAASPLDVIGFKVKVSTPMHTERWRQSATPYLKKEPVLNGPRVIEGEFEIEYSGLTEYNRYVNGTVVAMTATWTGSLIEGSIYHKLAISVPNCRFDKPSGPNVEGPDLVTFTAPFKGLYDDSAMPFGIVYTTTDTAL